MPVPEDSAKLDYQGGIVRVPGRAAQMVKDRGRNRPIQHVEFWIVLCPAQDLEIGSVRPNGVYRPDQSVNRLSESLHSLLVAPVPKRKGGSRGKSKQGGRTKQNGSPC